MQQVYKFEKLPIYNFREIINTNDHRWLLRSFEGEGKELSKPVAEALYHYWVKIFYDYLDAMDEYDTRAKHLAIIDLKEMEFKYSIVASAYELYQQQLFGYDKKKLEVLFASHGIIVNYRNGIKKQYDIIERHLKMMLTNVNQMRNENEESMDEDKEIVKTSIYKDIVVLEEAIPGVIIDPHTCTCPKWIAYWKRVEQKYKAA